MQFGIHDLDWDILLDTHLLHLTGITPALSSSCFEITGEAIQKAKARGIPISFDINYRQKLWPEENAANTLLPLIQGVEILFCSQTDAIRLFHLEGSRQETAQKLLEQSKAHFVVMTSGEHGALLWNGNKWIHESAHPTKILDRLGAGDALAAGVIQGWLDKDIAAGLRYGVTLAALALTQFGDMVITNKVELLALSQQSSTLTR
jgi:2-dehydro-3-deoxygluconokinase